MKQLLTVLESSALRVPEWHELKRNPADTATPQSDWRTDILSPLAVGPVDLKAGDVLDVRLHHEFDAEMDGAGYYTVGGMKSEHWSLWIMQSTRVQYWTSIIPSSGRVIMPAQEENWDWYVHHKAVNRSGLHTVISDMPAAYIYDRVYFVSGMSYTRPEVQYRQVQINGGQYPKLSVGIFREGV